MRDGAGKIILDEKTGLPDKILMEDNISPTAYEAATSLDPYIPFAIVFFLVGLGIVFLMGKADDKKA